MQRHEAFLLDDLLAVRRKNPLDVFLDLAGWLTSGVKVELSSNRIFSVAGNIDAWLDTRFALFVRDFQPVHSRRLVAHPAVAKAGGRFGDVLDHFRRAVHLADAAAKLALLAILFAADVLTEVV